MTKLADLSILLESYCNLDQLKKKWEEKQTFNSPRVLLQPENLSERRSKPVRFQFSSSLIATLRSSAGK
ncbi:protein of unknown function [Thermococcus nautili]|nr:protein of unknown function [Thermococcus nautili]